MSNVNDKHTDLELQARDMRKRIDDLEQQEDDALRELHSISEGIDELESLQAQQQRISGTVGDSPMAGNGELLQRLFTLCSEQLDEAYSKVSSIRAEKSDLHSDYAALHRG